ncbi:beta-1,3-galactosyltransferase 6-like [Mya arenaria]|uniref:beta-1,3-galactosyltransferase 6-like n=1 Tax=Mya arenaria TaxID=6604 RepID=UPI0022E4B026|nr:beta-1,3-galactosyltransferase 6-like [Mya arenaria]
MLLRLRRRLTHVLITGLAICAIMLIVMTLCPTKQEGCNLQHPSDDDIGVNIIQERKESVLFSTNLLVVVISAPSHEHVRNVIRETWAKNPPVEVRTLFVIGVKNLAGDVFEKLVHEKRRYSDMLFLENLEESYSALTRKIIETFKFVCEKVHFKFLLKVDEDSYVRVDKISYELLSKPQQRLYWGFFDGRAHVKKAGKWEERDYVLCDRYLPYALGGGYVISSDLVEYVAKNSEILKLYQSEDVSLGTWLGPLDVHRVHDPNFDTEYKSRGCFNSYLVTHKKSPEQMKVLYDNLQSHGKLCDVETRTRLSYQYKWDLPPSQCCERKDPTIP